MKWINRILVLLALCLILSIAGAVGWAHYYLNSPRMGEKIRKIIAQRFFTHLEFSKAEINLWSGLKVTQAKLFTEEERSREFVSLNYARLEYAPLSLLNNTIEIETVHLNAPTIQFQELENGLWNYPRHAATALPELTFRTGIFRFNILLRDLLIDQGRILILSAKKETLFEAQGVGLNGQLEFISNKNDARGTLTIKSLQFGPYVQMTQAQSPFEYADSVLKLPKLSSSVHGGTCSGAAQINTGIGGPTFMIDLILREVNLSDMLKGTLKNSEFIQGQLQLMLQLTGSMNEPLFMQGTGSLNIGQAKLNGVVALEKLGAMLNLAQLRYNQFDSIRGSFKVSDQKITFYELEAKSKDITFTGTGTIGFDRKIDFDVLLILSPEMARQIPTASESKFGKRENATRTITFKLSGTLDEPESNLSDKLSLTPASLENNDQASL